ncbi:DUF1127 domain-containing protein [Dongia rigui]|uniref:DUF1127 domain-containing protein n=1 Tax=Dongia rigui TaxID=940149 RepID=A0ABU5DVI8_9PROT|nr:DUF1127 domain-containing protein [Dongia rigui]MDY0871299.1 DUF1127 domain-containing protein [Dongia rigui]
MNRIVINQNVASSQALSASATKEIGLAAFARFGRAISSAVRRTYARIQLENELYALDDRSLNDIGVGRGSIPALAREALPAGDESLFAEFSRLVVNGVLRPAIDWNRRRKARATLEALDDRLLADIGLARFEIEAHVARLSGAINGALPATVQAMEEDVTAPLKAWSAARATAKELSRLTDRQLMDIGVIRGDIDELAGNLAERGLAANSNALAPKAA